MVHSFIICRTNFVNVTGHMQYVAEKKRCTLKVPFVRFTTRQILTGVRPTADPKRQHLMSWVSQFVKTDELRITPRNQLFLQSGPLM